MPMNYFICPECNKESYLYHSIGQNLYCSCNKEIILKRLYKISTSNIKTNSDSINETFESNLQYNKLALKEEKKTIIGEDVDL
jgi:hypothetical protein